MKTIFLSIVVTLSFYWVNGQVSTKLPRFINEPVFTDSVHIFFPVSYNENLLSNNKIALFGNYYANFIVYDVATDHYKKLFDRDIYILPLNMQPKNSIDFTQPKSVTPNWIFLFVKHKDYNESERVDERDPSILFAVKKSGKELRQLTLESENVLSINLFEKQGFGLVKMQKDSDGNKSFKGESIYFRKINLTDLSLGKEINTQTSD
jgi:hypothetical protein